MSDNTNHLLREEIARFKAQNNQLIELIQEAKKQIVVDKKPMIAYESLQAATDILGNPDA